ncbi:MAG: Gfo/Idh/MocA family oxidoreductase, partial [Ruminococcus sp.]|nr:Gfo/Idh/MocA family oxidoreductase [Ruminococcus sp.]
MKKLKGALIGAGGIGRGTHTPAYEKMDNVEIVAVCDIIEERAKLVAERLGAKDYFTDYKDVLKIEGLDFVDICTPNYYHSVIAIDALNAGINVFC